MNHADPAVSVMAGRRILWLTGAIAVAWALAMAAIQPLANWLAYTVLAQPQGSALGDSLAFFFYDVPKILLLLAGRKFPPNNDLGRRGRGHR
jgi:hypothetical protein